MSIFSSVASWFGGGAPEVAPESPVSQPSNAVFEEEFWREIPWLTGAKSTSGEGVNWKTAMGIPTALRCAMVIADGVATVPCKLMRKDPATGKRVDATDHPAYWMFKRKPSPIQNTLEFRETMALHCVLSGNAYAYKNMVRGRLRELIVVPPHHVSVRQNPDYTIEYRVTAPDGTQEIVPADLLWHLRGPSWDGYCGLDIVYYLRNALGLAMATERAHAARFSSGIQTSGLYSVEGNLDEAQYKRLTAWITKNFTGPQNSGKPMVLDRSAKFMPTQMSGVDAEHVNTRMLQIEQICTGFGVKPIMVGHADKSATYASAEQQFLAHAVHTIRPWHRRFEASMNADLLTEQEMQDGYYFKFVDMELLRGSATDRADYFLKMASMGAMSPNDIAGLEDFEATDAGDMRFRPAQWVPLTEETNAQTLNSSAPTPAGGDNAPSQGNEGAPPAQGARMNVGRVLSSENESLIRAASGNLETVLQKLDAQPTEGDNEA